MFHDEHHSGGVTLSPKVSFALGLVGGVLILCTIGFFILLSLILRGGGLNLVAGGSVAKNDVALNVQDPSPSAPSEDQVGEVKAVSSDDHVLGANNAAVTLIEYSDFECPFCGRFHPTMQQLIDDPAYKGKVRWVYRHFPLSFHPSALPAANAAECASEQGKFWEFADGLFTNQTGLNDTFYKELATKLKLNLSKFDTCYSSKKYDAKIKADQTSGATAGVTGTPGTIILAKDGSKQLIPGALPYEQVKAMVDAALK